MKIQLTCAVLSLSLCCVFCGCGPAESVIPTGELTDAQKAAIKLEDEAVAMDESQGSVKKGKGKKK